MRQRPDVIRRTMNMKRSRAFGGILSIFFSLLLNALSLVTAQAFAEQPILTPFKASGIYGLNERAGWTVSAPAGATLNGEYNYVVRKNNLDALQSGKLDLSQPATIQLSLNEPAMLYLEITTPESNAKPLVAGAAIAPEQLRPAISRPADFNDFWAKKIAQLKKVPPNIVLTPKDSGRPDVEYFILRMDHIDGRHIYGQVARPKRPGKFPGLAIFQWANPPYA